MDLRGFAINNNLHRSTIKKRLDGWVDPYSYTIYGELSFLIKRQTKPFTPLKHEYILFKENARKVENHLKKGDNIWAG